MKVVVFGGFSSREKLDRAEVTHEVGSLRAATEIHHVFLDPDSPTGVLEDGEVVHYNLRDSGSFLPLFWAASVDTYRYMVREGADVVYSLDLLTAPFVGAACRLAGVPYILRMGNDIRTVEADRGVVKSALYNVLWRSGLRLADAVHANSEYMKTVAEAYGAPAERVHCIYPNIDLPQTPPVEFPDGQRAIVYAGRLHPRKRIELVIDAMAEVGERVPDSKLYLVGEDVNSAGGSSYRDVLKARVERAGVADRVEFVGWVPYEEVFGYLRGAEVVVSTSRHEGVNKVALESLLCGTPLVASDIPTHRELVGDDHGVLVDPTTESVADGIVGLLEDDRERDRMGERGRAFAERITAESEERWQQLFAKYDAHR